MTSLLIRLIMLSTTQCYGCNCYMERQRILHIRFQRKIAWYGVGNDPLDSSLSGNFGRHDHRLRGNRSLPTKHRACANERGAYRVTFRRRYVSSHRLCRVRTLSSHLQEIRRTPH